MEVGRRQAVIHRGQRPTPLNEVPARETIDSMPRAPGWMGRDQLDLQAVREFTPATGRADYVLYVDGRIAGVIEAKREDDRLSAVERNEPIRPAY
ncbi:hypothetical protein ACLGIH_10425 [Streptomyces sp. HMX87]|uniref:hypothetical protein n=1 Tax=Streptomyces sp. HMX87 TaxID=3390849 RepID=UPI003A8610C6